MRTRLRLMLSFIRTVAASCRKMIVLMNLLSGIHLAFSLEDPDCELSLRYRSNLPNYISDHGNFRVLELS